MITSRLTDSGRGGRLSVSRQGRMPMPRPVLYDDYAPSVGRPCGLGSSLAGTAQTTGGLSVCRSYRAAVLSTRAAALRGSVAPPAEAHDAV